MSTSLKMIGALLALSALPRTATAQPLSHFLRNASTSLDARESVLLAQQRADEQWQVTGRLLPSLTARAGYTFNQFEVGVTIPTGASTNTQATITPRHQADLTVTLDVPLVDPAGWARVDAARASREASQVRVRATSEDVLRAVARSYFQWAAAGALVRSSERALLVAQRSLDRVRARLQAGGAVELDVARASSEVARAQQTVADAMLARQTAARSLESLTQIAPREPVMPPASLEQESPLPSWEALASQTTSVRQATLEARAQHAQSRAAWLGLSPTVNASATERVTNATGFGPPATFAAGVSVSWRIDVTSVANARAASAASAIADVRLERALQNARDQIHSAWWQVNVGVARVRASRARLESAQRATSSARARLAQGAGNEHDVLLAERDEFDAEVAGIQADADLAFARVALRIAAGQPLEGGAQ